MHLTKEIFFVSRFYDKLCCDTRLFTLKKSEYRQKAQMEQKDAKNLLFGMKSLSQKKTKGSFR